MSRIPRSVRPTLGAVAAGAALAVVPAVSVSAQQPRAARDTAALRTVVVTATRIEVPLAVPTASTTVVRGEDLRARGLTNVTDALREVAGVSVAQQGSFGGNTSLFVRGGQNNYTKVLVDGAPANAPGGSIDLAYLTLDNVERIEIVRGPASVLYGSDAVSGVIQIFTRRGGAAPLGMRGMARVGGYRNLRTPNPATATTAEGELAVHGTTGGVAYSASGARYTTDGVLPVNNGFDNAVGSVGLRYATPSARSTAELSGRVSAGRFHYPTTSSGWVPARPDSNAFTESRRLTASLDLGHRFTSRFEGRLLLTEARVRDEGDNAPDSPRDTTTAHSHFANATRRRAADARLNVTASPGHVVTGGVELSGQGLETSGWSRRGTRPRVDNAPFDTTRRNTGVYAQYVGQLGERASITAGTRLDDNQYFGTFGTYRVGVGLRVVGGLRVRAAAGTAFKEPTFDQQFNTAFTNGNRDLNPERTRSWEVGLEQSVGSRVTASATYFDQRFRDMVVYQFNRVRTQPDYFNVAAALSRGVEAELRGQIAVPLSAGVAYSYVHTEVTDAGRAPTLAFTPGRPLLRRPRTTVTTDLRYRPTRVATTSVVVTYVGARPDLEFLPSAPFSRRVRLGGYADVDLTGDVRVLAGAGARPPVALSLRLDNAFDRRIEALKGFPSPGRVAFVGVRFGEP